MRSIQPQIQAGTQDLCLGSVAFTRLSTPLPGMELLPFFLFPQLQCLGQVFLFCFVLTLPYPPFIAEVFKVLLSSALRLLFLQRGSEEWVCQFSFLSSIDTWNSTNVLRVQVFINCPLHIKSFVTQGTRGNKSGLIGISCCSTLQVPQG